MYPQNNWQQQQQLPFSTTQAMHPLVPANIGYPPYIPQVNCPQFMQQYVAAIASLVINELVSKATTNQLRIFAFNLYARNQYANTEFVELVEMCCNYTAYKLQYTREFQTVEQAIQTLVPRIVQTMCGAQGKFYPQLYNETPPNMHTSMNACVSAVSEIVNSINILFQNQGNQPQVGAGYSNQFQQQFVQNQPMQGQSVFSNRLSMGGLPNTNSSNLFSQQQLPEQMPSNHQTSAGGASNRYRRQLEQMRAGTPQGQGQNPQNVAPPPQMRQTVPPPSAVISHSSAADILKQPFENTNRAVVSEFTGAPKFVYDNEQTQQQINPEPAATSFNQPITSSRWLDEVAAIDKKEDVATKPQALYHEKDLPNGAKWKRSDMQPYHPAWNPKKQKIMYTLMEGGTVLAVNVNLSESEKKMMEYEKHAIGVTPVDIVVPENKSTASEDPIINNDLEPYEPKVVIEDVAILVDCEESASIHARFKTLIGKKLQDIDAYCVKMCVATPLICTDEKLANEYREIIANLSNAQSFKDALEIINGLKKKDFLPLRHHLNAVLTKEVNSALALEMGMQMVYIDSFVDDIESLLNGIKTRHGETVFNLFKSKESYIIDRSTMPMDSSETSDLVNNEFGDLEGFDEWGCEVVYAASVLSYTHLNERADELNLALLPGETAVLDEATNAKLYAIIDHVLGNLNGNNLAYRRNYVITMDGLKFEVARGFINKQSLLIRKA